YNVLINGAVISFSIANITTENNRVNRIVFPLSSVTIAINNTIAVKLKNCSANKLNALPKYIRLEKVNNSSCTNSITATIAVMNGISSVTIMEPSEKTRYFDIKIWVLLLPLMI